MTTLQDLKTEYQNRLDIQEVETAAQEQAKEALRQLKLDGLKPHIIKWIATQEGANEAELDQGEVTGDWDDWNEKLRYITITLTFPEHQPISFIFYEDADHAVQPNSKSWKVQNSGRSCDTLGEALVMASQVYQKQKEYQEREEADSQEYKARQAAKKEREETEQTERNLTILALANDPVAFLLLKLFAEIQQERAGVAKQITSLEEAMGNAEYHYDAELSATRRRVDQERQEVERIKNEARSLQYRVDDLDSELAKTKKQQRGW